MRRISLLTLALLIAATLGGVAAQEQDMPPEMAAMMKYAAPGEHHEHMSHAVGSWKAHTKMWMAPGAPPAESDAHVEVTAVLGGRFFQTHFSGKMMGMDFEGIGMDGFDNMTGKHFGTWADSMGTMMSHYEGSCSDGGKVTTVTGEMTDPSGAKMTMKSVTTVHTKDKWTWEAWMQMPDGSEFKTMEISYTRM